MAPAAPATLARKRRRPGLYGVRELELPRLRVVMNMNQ
jgi:hypothetical protein